MTARLEPATIDGLVYASSMVVLYAARHRLAVPALARWLLALGIVAAMAANVAHGWPGGPVGAAVAAWPAASLVGSYELLLWLVRTATDGGMGRDPVTGQADRPSAQAPPALRLVPIEPGDADEDSVEAAAVAAYQAGLDIGGPLSERKLAEKFGKISRRWARHRMAEARLRASLREQAGC